MKYRIRALGKYQKAVLAVAVLLVLVFSVIYPVTMGREGYLYRGALLTPGQEEGGTVYTGTVNGVQARFTVAPDRAVTFQYGEATYGPYTAVEDPSAVPENVGMSGLTGVELRKGEEVIFRGGVVRQGDILWLYHENGDLENGGITITTSAGVTLDENGNVVDPNEPSLSTILELMDGPALTHKGDWLPYLLGVFLCAVTAVTILFADELFRFQLSFRVRDVENAEPTDLELFGRYAGLDGAAHRGAGDLRAGAAIRYNHSKRESPEALPFLLPGEDFFVVALLPAVGAAHLPAAAQVRGHDHRSLCGHIGLPAVGALVVPGVVLDAQGKADGHRYDNHPGGDEPDAPGQGLCRQAAGEDENHPRRRAQTADDRLQPEEHPVVLLLLAAELQQVLFRFGFVVFHDDLFPGQELVDGDAQQLAQGEHQRGVWQADAPLPLGDRPVGDPQTLPQGGLGKTRLLAPPGNKFSCLFLVHGEPPFCDQPTTQGDFWPHTRG